MSRKAVHEFGGAADGPRRVAGRVQSDTPALRQILLPQNAEANVLGFAFAGAGKDARRQLRIRGGASNGQSAPLRGVPGRRRGGRGSRPVRRITTIRMSDQV